MFVNPELQDLLRQPYLNSAKLMTLIRRYRRTKDEKKKDELREQIFNNNVRFIRKRVLKKVASTADNVEDVFNSAVISFFHGLDKFKPSKGFTFQTYIAFWIDKAIFDEYVSKNIVYVSKGDFYKKDAPLINSAKNNSLRYLDKPVQYGDGDGSLTGMDVLSKLMISKDNPELDYVHDRMKEVNEAMSKALCGYEKAFLTWRYIFEPHLTLQEIASIANVTKERVRQVNLDSMRTIRRYKGGERNLSNLYLSKKTKIPDFTENQVTDMYLSVIAKRTPDGRTNRVYAKRKKSKNKAKKSVKKA